MDEQKLYHKYATKEDRLNAWRQQRAIYDEWRSTSQGRAWVNEKSQSQLGLCFTCLTPLKHPIHVDHIFPLYLGGTNAKANLCVMHGDCNMRKGATVYMSYRQACKRRKLFNDLSNGIKLYYTLKVKPNHTPSKKGLKCLSLAKKYFSEERMDALLSMRWKKKEMRKQTKRRASSTSIKVSKPLQTDN